MLLRTLLLTALLAPALTSAYTPIRPPYLCAGDTIAIVAPAGKLQSGADTTRTREYLESWGLHIRFASHYAGQETPYFSGTDAERAADLQQMIDDPSIRAIIAFKGGYGAVRLLPLLDLHKLRHAPKWIVGFSDITMLHMALGRLGVESIHGPMPSTLRYFPEAPEASTDSLKLALFGQLDAIAAAPHPLSRHGVARGTVAGGNLTLICSAFGTPEQIDPRQHTILLIEEVGEAVYRLDRMMQQLQRSGLLKQAKAILIGHFTDMKEPDKFGDPYQVIDSYTRELGIPVVFGFPSGHELPNHPVFMNREAELTVSASGAQLRFL